METKKGLFIGLWVLCAGMSLLLNFNLFGALILHNWAWIMKYWLCGIGIYILPIYYSGIYFILIFGFKPFLAIIKNPD